MERRSTFFGIFGQIIQHTLRRLILFGRQYQIVAASYLIAFCIGVITLANQPVSLPPLPPPTPQTSPVAGSPTAQSSTPASSNLPSSTPNSNPEPESASYSTNAQAPSAVAVAQIKAYKNGNSLTLRFDKPVVDVQLVVDEIVLKAECKGLICTTNIEPEAMQAQVFWSQGGERFRIDFRLY